MVACARVELATNALSRRCSTTELTGYKYTMEDLHGEDFTVLYMHSNKPYKQKMFSCVPADFVLDPHPPQDKDFRETNLKRTAPPLPSAED